MRRINLPEIEDFPGCPTWLRNAMTGYLEVSIALVRPYAVAAPILAELLRESSGNRILDLASGGGGPWPALVEQLSKGKNISVQVMLSDIRPNRTAAAQLQRLPGVSYLSGPVSALEIPPRLDGIRTLFTGLHHFDKDEVRSILRSAQEARVPFPAAEATHRSIRGLLVTLLIPLLVLLLMPRVRPLRIVPLIRTYLPPVLPILIWWDGFASTMKTYRPEELWMTLSQRSGSQATRGELSRSRLQVLRFRLD